MGLKAVVDQALTNLRPAALALAVAACGGDGGNVGPVAVSYDVDLAPGEYAVVSGSEVSGALAFPLGGAGTSEYLVLGQLASTRPDLASPFVIRGQTPQPSASVSARLAGAGASRPALRFHAMLRQKEAAMARRSMLTRSPFEPARLRTPPPVVGSQRTFKVCADLDCDNLDNVTATARFVGTHAAIYVDNGAPANGFSDNDLAQLGTEFDTVLYPINVARFGAESDIDNNGVVVVLLSGKINDLVAEPDCDESFITGFFFGADIDPLFASQYNNGEVFYGMVPDPTGSITCSYSTTLVQRVLPVTFIHEFQHMISFNQHVLVRNGFPEELWLNEGLSHFAEELAGLHYDSLNNDAVATRYLIGNFFNAFAYLSEPEAFPLIAEEPPGSLESRGAGWLFVRYLADQGGPSVIASLVQTSNVGAANAQMASGGLPIETLIARFGLALYVSHLPNFSAPPELRFSTWNFRSTFANLNQQIPSTFTRPFPLVPHTASGSNTSVSGEMLAGSGAYVLATRQAGAPPFDLFFRRSTSALFAANAAPQVALIRIR